MATSIPSTPTRVLVVEDNPGDVLLLERGLDRARPGVFALEVARSYREATEAMNRAPAPDIAVLDLNLPDSRGLDTFARFSHSFPGLPVVILSGEDDLEVALEAVSAGAQDYLVKGETSGLQLARSLSYAVTRQARLHQIASSTGADAEVSTIASASGVTVHLSAGDRSGPGVTLETASGQTHALSAGNRSALVWVLGRAWLEDTEATDPTERGWCSDHRVVIGVWGRRAHDRGPSSYHVLLHRLRRELQDAGFDPAIIQKRTGLTRIDAQWVRVDDG